MKTTENFTVDDALEFLRKQRESNQRKSADIQNLSDLVLSKINNLGTEKYIILEQLINAALDYHAYQLANEWITMLAKEFPGSMRVMRYQGMLFEAAEEYDEALQIYDNIIKADETNSMARKRRIAIFKAQGLIAETIKELVDYLKKFMSDMEAWQELSELYLQTQDYSKAAFCTEELILHQPHNHLFHQRLADIRYTMGGLENMEMAKTYYCQALKLNPDNMRALLGLFLTTNNLLNGHKTGGKRKELWKLSQWTQAQISRTQREKCDSAVLHEMMVALAINE
ncbi:ER membrane protein complex subunit 2-like [Aricia agestis]|uniref:ER membrane protein complex subunit 2-like n=1 Tax=Aricia agestis TaxID=91739 RepID=UPI001C208399|nr:ER membrane protein complex subunit 2-like [Aricia agestis]